MSEVSCSLFEAPACTACDPRTPATPLPLANRPGLARLRYRIGTFSSFRESMLNQLSVTPVRSSSATAPTRELTSRASDDYAVAILELWAYVCDVLTFYQQAIVNESFLRTATERDSLARIAALLGYVPGSAVAASAWVRFTADRGATVRVPAGLKIQSDPPPDQNPETFETSALVVVAQALNELTLLPAPTPLSFERGGDRGGEILARSIQGGLVGVGTKLLFFDTASNAFLTEDVVTAITPTPRGRFVHWRASLGGSRRVSATTVVRFDRKFRYFGAHAPAEYLKGTPVTPLTTPPTLEWTPVTMATGTTTTALTPATGFGISGSTLDLDGVYEGLAVGSQIYLASGSSGYLRTITAVAQGSSSRGPLSGTCTVLTINSSVTFSDLRALTIYEIVSARLPFLETGAIDPPDPNDVGGGDTTIYLHAPVGAGVNAALTKGSYLAVVDPRAPRTRFDIVQVSGPVVGGGADMAAVPVTPPLVNLYDPAYAKVYANIVPATQGEQQREQVLGDGDASQAWQEFRLSVAPITYVPDAHADRGTRSSLLVFVNDVQWMEVDSFFGRGPDEPIFLTRVDEEGTTTVRFGDGQTGRRLPTGRGNVRARLRKGAGATGNVDPGRISVLLQTMPGLKAVANPLPAFGGADGEMVSALRENAPSSVVTLGRAVSLRDYEALSLTYKGIVKARASWAEFGSRRGVALTLAAAGSQPLALLAPELKAFLDTHRDPNVPLNMREAVRIPFKFRARLHVDDGVKQSAVKAAAEAALGPGGSGYLSYDALQFGQTIFQSEPIAVLQAVPGVRWVELLEFSCTVADHPFGGDPLHREAIVIGPSEIAWPSLTGSTVTATVELQYTGGFNDLETL